MKRAGRKNDADGWGTAKPDRKVTWTNIQSADDAFVSLESFPFHSKRLDVVL